jgi:hypothetical protein
MSSQLLRQDYIPVAGLYLIIMATLAIGLRLSRRSGADSTAPKGGPATTGSGDGAEPETRPGLGGSRPAGRVRADGWRRLIINVAGTAVGGYLFLMIVVVIYYYGVARVGGAFIKSAFTGCALLIGLAAPVFAAASWLAERWSQRPGRKAAPHRSTQPSNPA